MFSWQNYVGGIEATRVSVWVLEEVRGSGRKWEEVRNDTECYGGMRFQNVLYILSYSAGKVQHTTPQYLVKQVIGISIF